MSSSEYYNLNSTKIQLLVSICMGSIFVLIGIPIWWKTTEVYRADLPYDEISQLIHHQEMTMTFSINVASKNFEINSEIQAQFLAELNKGKNSRKYLKLNYDVEYNTEMSQNDGINVELDVSPTYSRTSVSLQDEKFICKSTEEKVAVVLKSAAKLIKEFVIREEKLEDLIENIHSKQFNSKNPQLDIDRMRAMPASSSYDILFSVLVPEPHTQQVKWNIQRSIDCHLKPIINILQPAMDVNVGSQILLYTGISDKPLLNKSRDGVVNNYYLNERKLSLFVNPIEARLGSQQSSNPTLNFVVYLTPRKYCPLGIEIKNQQLSQTNAFLVPRWGAVMLYNDCEKSVVNLDEDQIMSVFIAQLKILLGVNDVEMNTGDVLVDISNQGYGFRQFELKHLYLSRMVEYLATTSHTLTSLADLLGKITNIVINDEVAEAIYTSVFAHARSLQNVAVGNYTEGLKFAQIAYKSSEKAFYDPTLLELLYFPEDQKFAIYIPLFLPISIPLLFSIIHAAKEVKKKFKKEKSD